MPRDRCRSSWVVLALGDDARQDEQWLTDGFARRVVRWRHAAPSGLRGGQRALGLGIDAIILVSRGLVLSRGRGPYLALSPWTAAVLRMFGKKNLAAVGLYATPNTRTFRMLRRILGQSWVLTTSQVEAHAWTLAGGNATAIKYGNTFGYPQRSKSSEGSSFRVVVAGTSDRDSTAIADLESSGPVSKGAVDLVIADGSLPANARCQFGTVTRPGYLAPADFGRLLASCDVAVIPLSHSRRSAGHMVMVGALEAGVPVMMTETAGTSEYIDGIWVKAIVPTLPLLEQAVDHAERHAESSHLIRSFWAQRYSRTAFIRQVTDALPDCDERDSCDESSRRNRHR